MKPIKDCDLNVTMFLKKGMKYINTNPKMKMHKLRIIMDRNNKIYMRLRKLARLILLIGVILIWGILAMVLEYIWKN